ncbi:MAG: S8 family serine peptidase [candidate division Zixibacteria bacterium]|nr:S8 family serine peptidase [candidate division Zixibacteria bacterium]
MMPRNVYFQSVAGTRTLQWRTLLVDWISHGLLGPSPSRSGLGPQRQVVQMKKLAAWTLIIACAMIGDVSWARNHTDVVGSYAPLRPVIKPQSLRLSSDVTSGHVVVKFHRNAEVQRQQARLSGSDAVPVSSVIARHGMTPLVPLVAGDAVTIRERRMAAEDRVQMNLPDMSLYYRTPISSPEQAQTAIAELNALDDVEIAYYEPLPEVASFHEVTTTPHWEEDENYIDVAPGGVDARAAWTLPGGDGTGVQIIDIEFGWQLTHEDLSKGASAVVVGSISDDRNHGTAVLGEMVSDRNDFGTTGISYNADIGVSSVTTQSMAGAMDQAVLHSEPGDLVLIELHKPGPRFNFQGREDQRGYVPMEYFQGNFDAILNAYANGVIVCEAAGNGAEDLDDPIYTSFFDTTFRHSHAIMCGAGNPPVGGGSNDRSKLDFSNWGERVNLQGYGVAVYTTGYANLYNGGSEDSWYTNSFSGTSSASPIVTGAVACLSGIFTNMLGSTLDSDSALALLVPTGSPQQNPNLIRHIGPRPNLAAAIAPLFDPVDSVWYGDIEVETGSEAPLPITLSNSHPVGEIYLPIRTTGPATIYLDSLTRGPRTVDFEQIQLVFDNRFNGEVGYVLRANVGGGTSNFLPAGTGVVANLWVRPHFLAEVGQAELVDSAQLGSSTRLRLTSAFDDGTPDAFTSGSITIVGPPCDCPYQSDFDENAVLDANDLNGMIDALFFNGPNPQDPDCTKTRADFNCDDAPDANDLSGFIDHLFFNGPGPCDPCVN